MARRRMGLALGSLVAIAVGCGGSNRSAPEQAGPVVTTSDGATPSTSSPSTQPSSTNGATAGAGAPTTTTTPTAESPPAATPPDASTPTALPPAPADQPPADECAGVLPAPGVPVEQVFDLSDIPFCHRPTSNERGTAVALGIGLHHLSFSLFPIQGGNALGSIQVDHQDTGPIYDAMVPTTVGFHAAIGTGVESTADRGVFTAYDDRGGALTTSPIHASVADGTPTGTAGLDGDVRLLKRDPASGGSALLTVAGPLSSPTYHVEKVSADGHRSAGATLDRAATDLAVAMDGHVLVLAGSDARWLDGALDPITAWFPIGFAPPSTPFSRMVLFALAGGDMALRDGAAWKALFRNGASAVDPVPDWLASRPGTEVAVVRGGRIDAVTGAPPDAYAGGGTSVEFLTPAGRSCGTVTLSAGPGTSQADIGADGTAFTFAVGPSSTVGHQLCTYRWWPGLLR